MWSFRSTFYPRVRCQWNWKGDKVISISQILLSKLLHVLSHSDTSQPNLTFMLCFGQPERIHIESRPLQLVSTYRTSHIPPHLLFLPLVLCTLIAVFPSMEGSGKELVDFMERVSYPTLSFPMMRKKLVKMSFTSSMTPPFTLFFYKRVTYLRENSITWPLIPCLKGTTCFSTAPRKTVLSWLYTDFCLLNSTLTLLGPQTAGAPIKIASSPSLLTSLSSGTKTDWLDKGMHPPLFLHPSCIS